MSLKDFDIGAKLGTSGSTQAKAHTPLSSKSNAKLINTSTRLKK